MTTEFPFHSFDLLTGPVDYPGPFLSKPVHALPKGDTWSKGQGSPWVRIFSSAETGTMASPGTSYGPFPSRRNGVTGRRATNRRTGSRRRSPLPANSTVTCHCRTTTTCTGELQSLDTPPSVLGPTPLVLSMCLGSVSRGSPRWVDGRPVGFTYIDPCYQSPVAPVDVSRS